MVVNGLDVGNNYHGSLYGNMSCLTSLSMKRRRWYNAVIKFASDTKLGGTSKYAEGQRWHSLCGEMCWQNLLKFDKDKCKVHPLERKIPWQKYRLVTDKLKSSSSGEKALGVLEDSELLVSQQGTLTKRVISSIWSCMNRSTVRSSMGAITHPYSSIMRPHLDNSPGYIYTHTPPKKERCK